MNLKCTCWHECTFTMKNQLHCFESVAAVAAAVAAAAEQSCCCSFVCIVYTHVTHYSEKNTLFQYIETAIAWSYIVFSFPQLVQTKRVEFHTIEIIEKFSHLILRRNAIIHYTLKHYINEMKWKEENMYLSICLYVLFMHPSVSIYDFITSQTTYTDSYITHNGKLIDDEQQHTIIFEMVVDFFVWCRRHCCCYCSLWPPPDNWLIELTLYPKCSFFCSI